MKVEKKLLSVATEFRIATMATVDGEGVALIVHAGQPDEIPLILSAQIARDLGKSLLATAQMILDKGAEKPPSQN